VNQGDSDHIRVPFLVGAMRPWIAFEAIWLGLERSSTVEAIRKRGLASVAE